MQNSSDILSTLFVAILGPPILGKNDEGKPYYSDFGTLFYQLGI